MKTTAERFPDKFRTWLTSVDPYQRGMAVSAVRLSCIVDTEVDDLLIQILGTDSEVSIRREVVLTLLGRADKKFWSALLERLQDEDWYVRGHAIIALKKLDENYRSVPAIATFLEQETHSFVRYCAGIM